MKKLASAALLASVGLLLIAGCAKQGDPADDGGKIIITYWPQPLVKDVEGMEAKYPLPRIDGLQYSLSVPVSAQKQRGESPTILAEAARWVPGERPESET